ncbi:pseudouridine synthase domain protein [Burkholderia cepacia]|nr:pseudouridine synthase domain protein [Burkholderia cepacia]
MPEEALGPRKTGPAAVGHLRIRLQSTAFTHRTLQKRAKPVRALPRARAMRRARRRAADAAAWAAAGSIESSPTFPLGVYFPGLTSPSPARFAEPNRAQRRNFRNRQLADALRAVGLPIKFFSTNFPLPRRLADRIRLWARSLPTGGAVRATCCISLIRGEQRPPGASKIAVCACALPDSAGAGRSGHPQRQAGQNYIQYE